MALGTDEAVLDRYAGPVTEVEPMSSGLGQVARGTPTRCAVLGSPIEHSLSPALHNAAYRHLGLDDWEYGRFEVTESGLAAFLDSLDERWRGLSLTMPLKYAALACVDELSELALRTEAVNTILLENGRRIGDNADVFGIVEAVRERGVDRVSTASVLGGGATARSALVALRDLADTATVYIRTPARIPHLESTAGTLGLPVSIAPWTERKRALEAPLVVSTTPTGATDDFAQAVPARPGVLLDVVYAPWPTALADAWARAGGPIAGGRDMLVHQAVRQVELMTGFQVPVSVLRDAGEAALAQRPGHR
jgi:shikimate dehydrogenase